MRIYLPVCICIVFTCFQLSAQFTNKFVTYSAANTPAFSGDNFNAIMGTSKQNNYMAQR